MQLTDAVLVLLLSWCTLFTDVYSIVHKVLPALLTKALVIQRNIEFKSNRKFSKNVLIRINSKEKLISKELVDWIESSLDKVHNPANCSSDNLYFAVGQGDYSSSTDSFYYNVPVFVEASSRLGLDGIGLTVVQEDY